MNKNCLDIDNAGNYSYKLKVIILCAERCEINFFKFVVDIMEKYIKQKALKNLNLSHDFKFLCERYD